MDEAADVAHEVRGVPQNGAHRLIERPNELSGVNGGVGVEDLQNLLVDYGLTVDPAREDDEEIALVGGAVEDEGELVALEGGKDLLMVVAQ